MDSGSDFDGRRVAQNESAFRDVNEGIEAGRGLTEATTAIRFVCECARLGCTELIELTPAAYRALRAHPRRFAVVPGHEVPEAEEAVERVGGTLIVQKVGVAGAVAEDRDPRSEGRDSPA